MVSCSSRTTRRSLTDAGLTQRAGEACGVGGQVAVGQGSPGIPKGHTRAVAFQQVPVNEPIDRVAILHSVLATVPVVLPLRLGQLLLAIE